MGNRLGDGWLGAAVPVLALLAGFGLSACASSTGAPEPAPSASSSAPARMVSGAASTTGRVIGGARDTAGDLAIAALDSGPAPHAGFLPEPERLEEIDRSMHPFQRVWVSPDHESERFRRIVIPPVEIEHMLANSWWDKMSTATLFGLDGDAEHLAERLHATVEAAFREDPNHRFEVVEQPDELTLILELALVEVVPNKSVIALGALAAMGGGPAVGSPVGFVASRTEHGYMAMEGRVRNGGTGKVVAMFTDRESAKTRVLDLQSVTWYGHAREIFDEWSEQLVAVANRPLDPGVCDTSPFTHKHW